MRRGREWWEREREPERERTENVAKGSKREKDAVGSDSLSLDSITFNRLVGPMLPPDTRSSQSVRAIAINENISTEERSSLSFFQPSLREKRRKFLIHSILHFCRFKRERETKHLPDQRDGGRVAFTSPRRPMYRRRRRQFSSSF